MEKNPIPTQKNRGHTLPTRTCTNSHAFFPYKLTKEQHCTQTNYNSHKKINSHSPHFAHSIAPREGNCHTQSYLNSKTILSNSDGTPSYTYKSLLISGRLPVYFHVHLIHALQHKHYNYIHTQANTSTLARIDFGFRGVQPLFYVGSIAACLLKQLLSHHNGSFVPLVLERTCGKVQSKVG